MEQKTDLKHVVGLLQQPFSLSIDLMVTYQWPSGVGTWPALTANTDSDSGG
jgi:hypothetical protein